MTQDGLTFFGQWTPGKRAALEAVTKARGENDWIFTTGLYRGERFYSARRAGWEPYECQLYVRDGFDRFLLNVANEQRDANGQKPVVIEEGNQEGRYFSPPRFATLKEMGQRLGLNVPGIANIKVWYDATQDFHILAFDVDGSHYEIRYYKVFCATKDNQRKWGQEKHFGFERHVLEQFFIHGNHRRWVV